MILKFSFSILVPGTTTFKSTTQEQTTLSYKVGYRDTTSYHWPNFEFNTTNGKRSGTDFEVVQGSLGFGNAVKLDSNRKQVQLTLKLQ